MTYRDIIAKNQKNNTFLYNINLLFISLDEYSMEIDLDKHDLSIPELEEVEPYGIDVEHICTR